MRVVQDRDIDRDPDAGDGDSHECERSQRPVRPLRFRSLVLDRLSLRTVSFSDLRGGRPCGRRGRARGQQEQQAGVAPFGGRSRDAFLLLAAFT